MLLKTGQQLSKAVSSLIIKRNYCKPPPEPWFNKASYSWFLPVQTRWKDNDQYLHMNNAVYHSIFDTVINVYLIRHIGLDIYSTNTPIGYMISGNCTFLGSARFPEVYLAGLGIAKIGNSSLHYRLSLFPQLTEGEDVELNLVTGHKGSDPEVGRFAERGLVLGEYTHVFVDPHNKRPTPVRKEWTQKLEKLLIRC
uniref:Uncharacterized protein n=1 Tax=Acartia pacifica TaxID=335913 RepID=A0A0U2M9I1_ACAPC|nr:putative uncharacterized protein LOC101670138 [Acartia pacifica]